MQTLRWSVVYKGVVMFFIAPRQQHTQLFAVKTVEIPEEAKRA